MFENFLGLTEIQASQKLIEFGENILPKKSSPSHISIFISQLKNPLVYVLLGAALITLLLNHPSDFLIILIAIIINTVLGFIQEYKANQSFKALNNIISNSTDVIRNGIKYKIDVKFIVPGDIVFLSQGSKVPADGKVVFANRAYFDEALITGESVPVYKQINDQIYTGCILTNGQVLMEVSKTGKNTKMGNIALEIQSIQEETPLKKQLTKFSKKLVTLVIILVLFVFTIGIVRGESLVDMFSTSVALAVSSIPEGLLVSLTVILAIGMQKILKRKGLVRKLTSAETLGGVTTICIDKTGTLTEGKLKVAECIGNEKEVAKQVLLANDLDDPILLSAFKWGKNIVSSKINKHRRLDSIPFSHKERVFISLNIWENNKNMLFVNGAPDTLLKYSKLTDKKKTEIYQKINELSSQGKRIIAFARKEVPPTKKIININDAKENLQWMGMLSFYDPVRPSVIESIKKALDGGIKIIVITGDYSKTAQHILSEIGINLKTQEIIEGMNIENMPLHKLANIVKSAKLFARTTPDQKLKIVRALQKNGEVVAMMGDGVNDAPAIHRADIGIVVADASDVARESADLVLLDSNFATIIGAIEEGRSIFQNIRKILLYLMVDAFEEIFIVIASLIFQLPLPITAVQIIWINLVSDGFPGLALTIDPNKNTMSNQKPRSPKESLLTDWMLILITGMSIFAGGIAFLIFWFTYKSTLDLELARSLSFISLGLNSLVYVFSVRTLLAPFWQSNVFENKWLSISVVAGLVLQYIPFLNGSTRDFFSVSKIEINYWIIAFGFSLFLFVIIEIFKYFWKSKYSDISNRT